MRICHPLNTALTVELWSKGFHFHTLELLIDPKAFVIPTYIITQRRSGSSLEGLFLEALTCAIIASVF
jgi:hypothetical protein